MPWKLVTPKSQRKELVSLALTDGANKARLCRRFEISRKMGYKWLARDLATGEAGAGGADRPPGQALLRLFLPDLLPSPWLFAPPDAAMFLDNLGDP